MLRRLVGSGDKIGLFVSPFLIGGLILAFAEAVERETIALGT